MKIRRVSSYAWPEIDCGNCGRRLPAATTTGRNFKCRNCGNSLATPSRDGVPWSVWLSLIDNEDAAGRVPADRDYRPSSAGHSRLRPTSPSGDGTLART